MGRPLLISVGDVFSRLTVIERSADKARAVMWRCACLCGGEAIASTVSLRSGHTRSCGCLRMEITGSTSRTHGKSGTRTYQIWNHMKRRCTDPTHPKWMHYGGRGVTVCERWYSFSNFLADMGEAPLGLSIDREDNDKGYQPGNCRWATQTQQTRNMRRNIVVTMDGKRQCLSAWCEELGVPYQLAYNRVHKLGWDAERALLAPRKRGAP
jgi:hypothetical protein